MNQPDLVLAGEFLLAVECWLEQTASNVERPALSLSKGRTSNVEHGETVVEYAGEEVQHV